MVRRVFLNEALIIVLCSSGIGIFVGTVMGYVVGMQQ